MNLLKVIPGESNFMSERARLDEHIDQFMALFATHYWKTDIRLRWQMDEVNHRKPHPVSGRQEKSVLSLGCNSGPSPSVPGADRSRSQTSAGRGNDV